MLIHLQNLIKNKYYTWYVQLIEFRKTYCPEGIVEKHHIIPRSLGGSNNEINIVKLTPREHFVAHLCLAKIFKDKSNEKIKMFCALNRMKNSQSSYSITSRMYDYIRKEHAENMKKKKGRHRWITNGCENRFIFHTEKPEGEWRYGYTHSEEHKKKLDHHRKTRDVTTSIEAMRKVNTGKVVSEQTRQKLREVNLGKTHTPESIQKMSDAQKGKKLSSEHKQKISEAHKGKRVSQEQKNKYAKTYRLVDPNGNEFVILNLKQFCLDNDLRYLTMRKFIDTDKAVPEVAKFPATSLRHNCTGWKIYRYNT